MVLTHKEKELAAVGISVASGCKPCTNYHVKMAREESATDAEIKDAVTDALRIRRSAADIMEHHGLARLGENRPAVEALPLNETNRVTVLVCVGAAFGVNCTTTLKAYLNIAVKAGISQEEIVEIVRLAAFIKERAASHVERLVDLGKEEDASKTVTA